MAIDHQWANVSLLLPLSENLLDVKGHSVTAAGGAALSSAVGTPFGAGNACYFDGADDVLTAPRAIDSVAFSIGAWVYVAAATEQCIFAQYDTGVTGRLSLYINSSGKLELFIGSGTNLLLTDSATFTTGSWRYVEVCRDGSGNTYLFNHGALAASGSNTQVPYNGVCSIGGQYGVTAGLTRKMTGYLSNVRIDNGTTRHTAAFTAPTAPFPRPKISGTVYDAAGAKVAKTILVRDRSTGRYLGGANSDPTTGAYEFRPPDFGECIVERIDGLYDPMTDECVFDLDPTTGVAPGTIAADSKGNALTFLGNARLSADGLSFFLDGSGDAIQATNNSFAPGTDDFCIDVEFMPFNGGHGSAYARVLQIGPSNTAGTLTLYREASTNPMSFRSSFYDTSGHEVGSSGATTYANDTWHKMQLRRVSGVFYLTINDTLVSTSSATLYNITPGLLSIGANTANGENFYGRIGKVRISRGSRRAAAAIPAARLLTMPADGTSGENAIIYDRVTPGG